MIMAVLLVRLQKWGYKLNAKCWSDQTKGTTKKHENLLSRIRMGK